MVAEPDHELIQNLTANNQPIRSNLYLLILVDDEKENMKGGYPKPLCIILFLSDIRSFQFLFKHLNGINLMFHLC